MEDLRTAPRLPGAVAALATWSDWTAFDALPAAAPRRPGAYLVADATGPVYAGMAGDRRGAGLRGRMTAYTTGKAAVSGLGRAVLDRALADEGFLVERLTALRAGTRLTAKGWAALALREAGLWVCWSVTADRAQAVGLEERVLTALHALPLWNLRRPRQAEADQAEPDQID
ncbi:hypothetical protein [Actinosynnema mirum]|uniref:GIY-YIG domain-containing protein n=1 Tax=Actinosynnema mirum (strain ATCC 29888 / DSM 43827 / JCM 3225 / NBRC 14064 / NCIMB 13271 / NRRL B-12336 / IMRU 3971 / 101) TaxID=446462 RepID=C6WAX0_ACTMD|nr:hypothetical protein [Actinosynnema mirum]ACU37439.1 hypothetical protein Amir_3548 [Actinosynnema mirum DSM 43827]